jgi:hypothetical protein
VALKKVKIMQHSSSCHQAPPPPVSAHDQLLPLPLSPLLPPPRAQLPPATAGSAL